MSLSVDERPCRRLQGLGAASLLKGTHDGSAHEGRALARAGQPVHLADDGVVELYVHTQVQRLAPTGELSRLPFPGTWPSVSRRRGSRRCFDAGVGHEALEPDRGVEAPMASRKAHA